MKISTLYNYFGPKQFYHYVFWSIAIISHMVDHIGIVDKAGFLPYLGLVIERNGQLVALVYINFYCLKPKLFPSNPILYWVLLLAGMVLFAFVHGMYRVWLFENYRIGSYENSGRLSYQLLANFLNAGRFVLISVLLKFTVEWFDQQKELAQAKVDKLQAELKYLKNQINPHFLFNTLNNLYSLSLKKSDKTPDVILRLSEMMEYMLYDSNEEKVRLAKDIEHLDNYIELERIRWSGEKLYFEKCGEISDQLITPFLFLPLVENVFKHGLISSDGSAIAKARLQVEKDKLVFEIENYKSPSENGEEKGTGLENLKKRLNHSYGSNYSLEIVDTGKIYQAVLKLNFV